MLPFLIVLLYLSSVLYILWSYNDFTRVLSHGGNFHCQIRQRECYTRMDISEFFIRLTPSVYGCRHIDISCYQSGMTPATFSASTVWRCCDSIFITMWTSLQLNFIRKYSTLQLTQSLIFSLYNLWSWSDQIFLRFSYFRTTEQNRPGFGQFAIKKLETTFWHPNPIAQKNQEILSLSVWIPWFLSFFM